MRYGGTENVEMIYFSPMDALNETHFITMQKVFDEPVFCVSCCCDDDWFYAFSFEDNTTYERVKFNIMDAIFNCETTNELLDYLDEVFTEGFDDVLIYDDDEDDECCGMCICGPCMREGMLH